MFFDYQLLYLCSSSVATLRLPYCSSITKNTLQYTSLIFYPTAAKARRTAPDNSYWDLRLLRTSANTIPDLLKQIIKK
jgi:hypothetical protein